MIRTWRARDIHRPGTKRGLWLGLFALGSLLAPVEAQPVPTNSSAPPASAMVAADGAPLQPVDNQAVVAQWRMEQAAIANTNPEVAGPAVSTWLDKLRAGQVPPEIQFEVLAAASKNDSPTNRAKLEQYLAEHIEEPGLVFHGVTLYGGNAEQGRKFFFENAGAACTKCHKVGREGGITGPALDGVATHLTRQEILESILSPDLKITPGYETFSIKLKDRTAFSGKIKNETDTQLTIECPPDGDITIKKSDIAERRRASSPMPDGFSSTISNQELRNLVEFLARQK